MVYIFVKKILIIGSSYSIKDTFSKKFHSNLIYFSNFRDAWSLKKFNNYDIIVVSGFHHSQIKQNFANFNLYILKYLDFLKKLEICCNNIILISTFIPSKLSFSRVVFFYKRLSEFIIKNKKIEIIYFKKIIHKKNKENFLIKLLKVIGFKFTNQNYLITNMENFKLKKIPEPKFLFLNIKRYMIIERFLRFFDI